MKKSFLSTILLTIGICLIVIGIMTASLLIEKKEETNDTLSEQEASEYIDKITKAMIDGTSKKELSKLLYLSEEEMIDSDIMSGKDMYLRQIPSKDILKGEDISLYQETADILADNLERKIQKNLEYNIEGIADGGNYWGVLVSYRSYYYHAYLRDLSMIESYLVSLAGYHTDATGTEVTDGYQLASYKARIKAAQILDSHLDDYVNTEETNKTYVNFNNKKAENSKDSFNSYMMNIVGYAYQFQGNISSYDDVSKYILEIDTNNPLAILTI